MFVTIEKYTLIQESQQIQFDPENEYLVVRQSSHIEEDLKRNWSSWNFGQEGFEGTREELVDAIQEAMESNDSFWISGFELWGDDIKNADIRELYDGYWVLVDSRFDGELACAEKEFGTVDEAIEFANTCREISGDGVGFNGRKARVIYSNVDMHVLAVRNY